MNTTQVRWVLGATIISESSWIFALLGVIGLVFSVDGGAALSWFAVMGIMSVGAFYRLVTLPRNKEQAITFSWRTLGFAVMVIYVVVATQVSDRWWSVDLLWFFRAETWGSATNRPIVGMLSGGLLWSRGVRLSLSSDLRESLSLSFRLGVVVLAVSVILDLLTSTSLGTFVPVFVFFAFGLGGLSIANLLPEGPQTLGVGAWPKVILGVVAPVVGVGLVLSLLHENVLGFFSRPFGFIWDVFITIIFWGIIWPIIFLLDFLFGLVGKLLNFSGPSWDPDPNPPGINIQNQDLIQDLGLQEATGSNAWVLEVIGWLLLTVLVVVLIGMVARVSRRILRRSGTLVMAERESIRGESDVVGDLANIMWGMLPNWMRRGGGSADFLLPSGPPGVVAALVFYYDLIALAEKSGYIRAPTETATEYQLRLELVLPKELIQTATEIFNRACYGNMPSTEGQINRMRSALKLAER